MSRIDMSRYAAERPPTVSERHTISLDGTPLRKVWVVSWRDAKRSGLRAFDTEAEAQRFVRELEAGAQ